MNGSKIFNSILLISLSCFSLVSANPCAGLWFGDYVANPDVCYKYYACILTIANERTCPSGNVFDPVNRRCVPGNQETCEIYGQATTTTYPPSTTEIISTTVEITTEEYTTPELTTEEEVTTPETITTEETTTPQPPIDLDAICRGVFFDARPHPYSVELFVGCIRGSGVLFTCFGKLNSFREIKF